MDSLVSLKAELERKRLLQQSSASTSKGHHKLKFKDRNKQQPAPSSSSNKGVGARDLKDKELTDAEKKNLSNSQSMLEKKAALYDKLHGGVDVLEDDQLNGAFLVNFQKKIVDTVLEKKKKKRDEESMDTDAVTSDNPSIGGDPEDWVEFTDSLGRSREVKRKDLEELMKEDHYLKHGVEKKPPVSSSSSDQVELLQEDFEDRYRENLRSQWEKKEEDNAAKNDLHYGDVRFNEARSHGVGFFSLSSDAEERQRQQDMLKDLHTSNVQTAKAVKADKKKKEKDMEKRLLKIRQRKRLKLGLPMIETEDKFKTPPQSDEEKESSDEETAPTLEPSVDVLTKREKETREWDVGKQVIGRYVEPSDKKDDPFERKNPLGGKMEISQETWIDRQRLQRSDQFAPPTAYKAKKSYPLYQREDDRQKKYNNQQNQSEDIFNECEGERKASPPKDKPRGRPTTSKGAAIPPPASFEYYNTSTSKNKRKMFDSQEKTLEEAIAKGLKAMKDNSL